MCVSFDSGMPVLQYRDQLDLDPKWIVNARDYRYFYDIRILYRN